MRRNTVWLVILIVIVTLALWFVIRAGFGVMAYYQLSVHVPTSVERWSVKELSSDQFAVMAHYTYEYQGKTYQGSSQVGASYPNPWAASRAQKLFASEQWPAWINPKHPERPLLEKKFPYKRTISAAILIGLLIYFAILSSFVRVKRS